MSELKNIELRQGPIVTGNGCYGPLMLTGDGGVVSFQVGETAFNVNEKWNALAALAIDALDLLVLDGPCRKPVFVPAESLIFVPSRKEIGEA